VAKLSSLAIPQQRVAHRANFCRQYLYSLKGHFRICPDHISEVFATNNRDRRVFQGLGGERARPLRNNSRETQQSTWSRLDSEDDLASLGPHRQRDSPALKNVNAGGRVTLSKENPATASKSNHLRSLFQFRNKSCIGDKLGGVLHFRKPPKCLLRMSTSAEKHDIRHRLLLEMGLECSARWKL
jgi:hypothetical protein